MRSQSSSSRSRSRRRVLQRLEDRHLLAGNGLLGQYYNTDDFQSPVDLTRIDALVDFTWGTGSPDASVTSDGFSVRWSGQVEVDFTETYTFFLNADDGARLWVNGQLLIDQFQSGSVTEASATINVIAGRKYDIQLEYLEDTGSASVKLEWSSPSLPRQVIPTNRLYAANRGSVLLETWTGISGSSVSDLTTDGSYPDAPSSDSNLTSLQYTGNAGDDIGQRLRGYLHPAETGPYTFHIAANESAELWLSNTLEDTGKQLIAQVNAATGFQQWDDAPAQTSGIVHLVAGQKYAIEVLHKESTGQDHLSVGWTKPGNSSIEVITGEYLSPVLPTVKIYADLPMVSESAANVMRFEVVRSGAPNNQPLDVQYSLSGDATNGVDYQTLGGVITIPANADSVSLDLTPITDSFVEGDESVVIEINKSPDYNVGYKSERTSYGNLADDAPSLPGGSSLWTGQQLSDFSHFGATVTTEPDPTYGSVIQTVIGAGLANPWNAQLRQNIDAPVEQGDILWVSFLTRSTSGTAQFDAIFERGSTPFTKSLSQAITVDSNWTRVQLPFYAAESYSSGQASFGFHLAYGAQTVQFTDFELLNYGPPQTLAPETAFNMHNISGTHGVAQSVPVTGQPFTFAYEVETQSVPQQVWHLQAAERNDGVVANGDTLRFEFSIRATSGAAPQAGFAVQRTDTFATLLSQNINLTSNWQAFSFDLTVTDDFLVDGLQAVFNLGFGLQKVEIGGFHWTNLNNAADIEDLPTQTPATSYDGRSGTASWREDADDRIESDRKSTVTVSVTDINGQPLDGAVVSLRQKRHEFLFGSAINAFDGKLDPNGTATALKYQSEIKRLFNAVVLENSLKWGQFLNDRARGIQGAQFATDNNLYHRGHNIIWPSRTFMPDSIWDEYDLRVANDGTASANSWLESTINARIDDVLTEFNGDIPEWDVVNEPFSNHDVMDVLGDSALVGWFQRVRDINPNIKLTLNDFDIFSRNGGNAAHRASFDYWLGLINTAGLLDVIGEQSHYNESNLTDIPVLGSLINTYNTQFNAPIAITEFDVNTTDEQLQADYLRDYMTMSFSQSAIDKFMFWGFWQSSHWLPDAALYRNDFSIKPNGQAYEDLVFGNWWTDLQGTTRSGAVTVDAFLGDYDVVVQYNGQTYFSTAIVDDSGASNFLVNVPQLPIGSDVPAIESVTINDNGSSRSVITSLTVTFDSIVDHSALDSAFAITNIDTSTAVGSIDVSPNDSGGKTTAILTFGAGASVDSRAGSGAMGNSLADGNYRLDADADFVRLASTNQAMASDYVFGGKTSADLNDNDDFYRLYGDMDGDGDTDANDLNDSFAPAFFSVLGDNAYAPGLDGDGDGDVDANDLNDYFAVNFFAVRQ